MRAVLADTGPLYALQDKRDAHHERAKVQLARLEQTSAEVILCQPILFESHALILYRLGVEVAQAYLASLRLGAGFLSATPEDIRAAMERTARFSDQVITLTDHTLAVLAKRLGVGVWTFDHHFDTLGASVWRV